MEIFGGLIVLVKYLYLYMCPFTQFMMKEATTSGAQGTCAEKETANGPSPSDVNTVAKPRGDVNRKRKRPKKKPRQQTGNGDGGTDNVTVQSAIAATMDRELFDGLTHCTPFRMMEMMHKAIRPDPSELFHACMQVKRDLMNTFQMSFQNVNIDVFGSTIIGTAFKGM